MVGEKVKRLNELISGTVEMELKNPYAAKKKFETIHSFLEKLDFSQGANSPGVKNLEELIKFSKLLDKPATKENKAEYDKYRGKNVYELYKLLYWHSLLLALEVKEQRVEPEKFDPSKLNKEVKLEARLMTSNFIEDLDGVLKEICSDKASEEKVASVIKKFTKAAGNIYGTKTETLANQAMQVTLYNFDLEKFKNYFEAVKELEKIRNAENPDEQEIKSLEKKLEEYEKHIEKVPGIAGLSGIKPFPEKEIKPVGVGDKGTLALFARLNCSRIPEENDMKIIEAYKKYISSRIPEENDMKIIKAYKKYIREVSEKTPIFNKGHEELIHPQNEYSHLYFVPMFASYHEVPEHISQNVPPTDFASAKAYYLMPREGRKLRILGVYLAGIESRKLSLQPSFNHFLLTRMLASMVKSIL